MSSNYYWQEREAKQRIGERRKAATAHRLVREARAGDEARMDCGEQVIPASAGYIRPWFEALKALFRPARRLAPGPCEGG